MPNWFLKFAMLVLKLVMGKKALAKQARQPSGWYGKYIAQPMFISGNAALNELIFSALELQPDDTLLEIGFGPGQLLKPIAEKINAPNRVFGLDFSPTMLQQATKRNQHLIAKQYLSLQLGDSSQMPYRPQQFTKICCANTLYFWQPPEPHLHETLRCLQPAGRFVMGFRDKTQIDAMQLDKEVFARYSVEQVKQLLLTAGFSQVDIIQQAAMPLDSYVAIATK